MERGEAERAADRAVVPIERSATAPAGDVKIGLPVTVAVERHDPSTHRVLERTVINVPDPGRLGLIHEMWRSNYRYRRPLRARAIGPRRRDRDAEHPDRCETDERSVAPHRAHCV